MNKGAAILTAALQVKAETKEEPTRHMPLCAGRPATKMDEFDRLDGKYKGAATTLTTALQVKAEIKEEPTRQFDRLDGKHKGHKGAAILTSAGQGRDKRGAHTPHAISRWQASRKDGCGRV